MIGLGQLLIKWICAPRACGGGADRQSHESYKGFISYSVLEMLNRAPVENISAPPS